MNRGTLYFPAKSELSGWNQSTAEATETPEDQKIPLKITLEEISTLAGARALYGELKALEDDQKRKIGVLNFASAKNPGGGFRSGASAQVCHIVA